ncbi:hypothetical protein EYZ11_002506 [Aspergillus tanneri]|nr:hypothetical protein EYZ11_002506 [Aspergillus tanneri]
MPSPTFAISRQAPPVRPSRSLEGMERVIPPESPVRPALKLDKPLPELPQKPLPATPSMEASTAWSDDSSLSDSFDSRRQSTVSTESYPVVVRSPSDDLAELVDHPPIPSLGRSSPIEPYEKPRPSPVAFSSQYLPWTPNRPRPNHYFREKKWDFFPELAIPSELPPTLPRFPPSCKPLKKDARGLNLVPFDFAKKSSPADRGGLTLAHDMRNSIRSYVQRRISKHSVDKEKSRRKRRPVTAPECTRKDHPTPRAPSSNYSDRDSIASRKTEPQESERPKRLSGSTRSSACEQAKKPLALEPIAFQRRRQLAVPISPYQKYGATIWDKSGREKRISYRQTQNVRFPRYQKRSSTPKPGLVMTDNTPPLSPRQRSPLPQNTRDCMRALQDRTSLVLVALEEAKQRVVQARIDRKRMQLKSQIRVVGPVSPHNANARVDPWI